MIEAFASLLIVIIIAVGAFYASLRYHTLVAQRDMLADEYKRATDHIAELEGRVMMLEAERDTEMARISQRHEAPMGYDVFNRG